MIANPKTPLDRLLWAYQFGHSWNRAPRYANLRNLDRGRILKMTGDEADAKLLIASWQDFEPNVDRAARIVHRRGVQPDGEFGPASELAINIKRCAIPDFAPPADAELAVIYDDPCLRGAVASYQEYAAAQNNDAEYVGGEGSWPKGCNPKYPNLHATRVNVITSGASAHQKAQLKEVLGAVERCEAQIGQHVEHILDGDPDDCDHDVRYQYIAGGVIGYNYFPRVGVCRQRLVGRLDNSFNVVPKTMAELNQHEYKGHGDGAEHKSRTAAKKSIMHPSIGSPDDWPTWIGDATEPQKRRWFGGVAIPGPTPVPTPIPIPTPGPGDPWHGAEILIRRAGEAERRAIVVPLN